MTVHIYFHDSNDAASITAQLATLIKQGERIMATLDQILADVTAESTAIAGLSTFIQGLKDQLAAALSGTTLPADVQAKVDQVFTLAEANKALLASALAANVPPTPAP